MYNLTHLSGVLSTPNLEVVDEKCALSPHYVDLLGRTSNDGLHDGSGVAEKMCGSEWTREGYNHG